MKNYTKRIVDKKGNVFHTNNKGQFHRIDGPSIKWTHGLCSWHINYKPYFKKQHNRLVLFCVLEPQKVDLDAQ